MRSVPLTLLAAVALVVGSASAGGADEPSGATAPAATSPAGTTPRCMVSGPAFDDRGAPLRAGLPPQKTLIALTADEVRDFPERTPGKVKARLKEIGAMLTLGVPNPDGLIEQKVPWQRDRRAKGRLEVRGERIDAPGGRFRVYINRLYGGKRFARFVPGSWMFSEPGCWRVKARAGKARVTYVVLVRRPEPGEFAPYLP